MSADNTSKLPLLLCTWQHYERRGTSYEALVSACWQGLAVSSFDSKEQAEQTPGSDTTCFSPGWLNEHTKMTAHG